MAQMRDLRVLVTAAGGPGAPGITWALRHNGERQIKVIGADMDPAAVGFALMDGAYVVPHGMDPEFTLRMLEIAQKEAIDVILPLSSMELLAFAAARRNFEAIGTRVTVSDYEALRIANDKGQLYDFLNAQGMACAPEHRSVEGLTDFVKAVYDLGYPQFPVVVKPRIAGGSRGFRILDAQAETLENFLNRKPEAVSTTLEALCRILESANPFPALVVMEYLPGKEYSVDLLADRGEPLIVIPRSRDRIKQGISVRGTVERNEELIELSSQVCRALGLSFNLNMQFRYDANNVPKLIEINPRLAGTVIMCVGAGVNLPYLGVKLALAEPLPEIQVRWNTRMARYWQEIFYDPNGHAYTL